MSNLKEIKAHLESCSEEHVKQHLATLPASEVAKLPPDWMQRLRGAGFSWASILALLIQGLPAILQILAQLFPTTPAKAVGILLAILLLLGGSAFASEQDDARVRVAIAMSQKANAKPDICSACGNNCICDTCICDYAAKRYQWVAFADDTDQVALYADGVQVGVWRHDRKQYKPYDAKMGRWGTYTEKCPTSPPERRQAQTQVYRQQYTLPTYSHGSNCGTSG